MVVFTTTGLLLSAGIGGASLLRKRSKGSESDMMEEVGGRLSHASVATTELSDVDELSASEDLSARAARRHREQKAYLRHQAMLREERQQQQQPFMRTRSPSKSF